MKLKKKQKDGLLYYMCGTAFLALCAGGGLLLAAVCTGLQRLLGVG